MADLLSLHPALDRGLKAGPSDFSGGTLACQCTSYKVEVRVEGVIANNHICGCTKCWKPKGAMFSMIAVVPRGKIEVVANEHKLEIFDISADVQRYVCKNCGVHMYGRIENQGNPFYGVDFIHPELFVEKGWPPPEFAAFVSSLIESGVRPERMGGVRARIRELGLEPYDCLTPALMDIVATHVAKAKGVLVD